VDVIISNLSFDNPYNQQSRFNLQQSFKKFNTYMKVDSSRHGFQTNTMTKKKGI